MSETRITRRLANMLGQRLADAGLDRIEDPRDDRGKRWPLSVLLAAVLVGIAAGNKVARSPTHALAWQQLIGDIFLFLISATAAQLDGLRRPAAPA